MAFHQKVVLWLAVVSLFTLQIACNKRVDGGEDGKGKGKGGGDGIMAYNFVASVCSPSMPFNGNCVTSGPGLNTCAPGGQCNIGLSVGTGNTVSVALNGVALANPQAIVCVPKSSSVTWSVGQGSNTNFIVDFGNTAPFQTSPNSALSYVTGSDGNSATETTPNSDTCYKYNVKVCPNLSTPSPTPINNCGESDPKVIIGNGN